MFHMEHCGHHRLVLSNLKPLTVLIAFVERKIIVKERKTLRNDLSNRAAMLPTI